MKERPRIVRKVARTRESKRKRGILSQEEIRRQIVKMLEDREARAYLFGSYARGEARPDSDVDILVVEKELVNPRLREIYLLQERLELDQDVDLIVVDEENFETWKRIRGTVQHEVWRKGIQLV